MRIDAHQHFWKPERGDYGWLTPALEPLYRDFLPADLAPLLAAAGIKGTVLVQAAPTVAETEWMLALAAEHAFIRGVVGWVDFEGRDAPEVIARLAKDPVLVGLRPMIQDLPDDAWMLRPDLDPAFRALIEADLTFDALVFPRHLGHLRALLARYPDMRVVIDHGAKPQIRDDAFEGWAEDMAALASETRAFCKVSGLVTEADGWNRAILRPYVAHLLEVFGPKRLIWGSDWPVCTLAATYEEWDAASRDLLGDDPDILGGTAARAYRLR